jgi:hypothetical protein
MEYDPFGGRHLDQDALIKKQKNTSPPGWGV